MSFLWYNKVAMRIAFGMAFWIYYFGMVFKVGRGGGFWLGVIADDAC